MLQNRRNRAFVATAFATWMVLAIGPPTSAQDPSYPLIPSHRRVNDGTLYESGLPPVLPASSPRPKTTTSLEHEGDVLYATHCASCHGANLRGSRGVPSLIGSGGAATDFYITTGRMPSAVRAEPASEATGDDAMMAAGVQIGHGPPLFDAHQTAAIVAYVAQRTGSVIPIPDVILDPALLTRGRMLFESNCESCHGAAGQGATAGYQWTALPLNLASPTQIGEAIRIGPGVMPRFSTAQLSDRDIAAVATYVRTLTTVPQHYGGTEMGYVGPAAEGAIGAFFGVGLLFWVVYFTGTKVDGRRFNEPGDDG